MNRADTFSDNANRKKFTGTAVDLFAGAGGVTTGLKAAGASVLAAVDLDPTASATYSTNHPEVRLLTADLGELQPERFLREIGLASGELTLLAACAPCQGYSTLGTRRPNDSRNDLVLRIADFVSVLQPRAVAFENVRQLARDTRFETFLADLRSLGYGVRTTTVDAASFQVPQRRRRLVVLAVAGLTDDEIPVLMPANLQSGGRPNPISVRRAFTDLPSLDGGDPLHISRNYPALVLERIRAVPKDGGSRRDLPPHLRLRCHEHLGSSAASAYGRMRWDDVAPTLTTRCTSPSCGRFIHPEEDRAITLREAATLQTFPLDYQFAGGRMAIEAQIGNAVPVQLAETIWRRLGAVVVG